MNDSFDSMLRNLRDIQILALINLVLTAITFGMVLGFCLAIR